MYASCFFVGKYEEYLDYLDRLESCKANSETFAFRLLGELTICAVFFALGAVCRNHIAYFCAALSLVMIPALFAGFLSKPLRGISVYYALSGRAILTDNAGLGGVDNRRVHHGENNAGQTLRLNIY